MTLIKLNHIKKNFGAKEAEVQALKGISLEIKAGELIAITGTSGSGKSTLLNILGCLEEQTSGSYMLSDHEINSKSKLELARLRNEMFGFVLQDFSLIESYTVKQNMLLPLLYVKDKKRKKVRQEMFMELVDKLGLTEKINTKVALLSGGQKQRVAIGRALINSPKVILADEPTGSLDKKTSAEILDLLLTLNKEGKTVIIITHDPKVANHCDREIQIEDGIIFKDILR
ncbi:MAG: ABC transporter ATP-binding protein [Defluviitaleaceae bacterium]|nr:ABC transporter ATP-binding protein [Defluviitaleaceae bacterium]